MLVEHEGFFEIQFNYQIAFARNAANTCCSVISIA